jgi:ABC-type sulfate transport system permease component
LAIRLDVDLALMAMVGAIFVRADCRRRSDRRGGAAGMTVAATNRTRVSPGRLALWAVSLAVITFLLAPILVIVLVSFDQSTLFQFPPTTWSLRWYTALWQSRDWREAFALSFWLASGVTALSLLFGVPRPMHWHVVNFAASERSSSS